MADHHPVLGAAVDPADMVERRHSHREYPGGYVGDIAWRFQVDDSLQFLQPVLQPGKGLHLALQLGDPIT